MTPNTHPAPRPETPRQEIRRLGWIVAHIAKLTPAGRKWLLSWLRDYERWLTDNERRAS